MQLISYNTIKDILKHLFWILPILTLSHSALMQVIQLVIFHNPPCIKPENFFLLTYPVLGAIPTKGYPGCVS